MKNPEFSEQITRKVVDGSPVSNQDIITYLEGQFPGGQHLAGETGVKAMNHARGFRRFLQKLDADCTWSDTEHAPLGGLFEAVVSGNDRARKGSGKNPVLKGSFDGVDYDNPRDYLREAHQVVRAEIFRATKMTFPNLAGNKDCDSVIRDELSSAGIELVEGERGSGEVPASVTGKLGQYTFSRAWYYWMVSGPVPLKVAEAMYKHSVGQRDVRVAGHCGCPPPNEWAEIFDEDGNKIVIDPEGTQETECRAMTERHPNMVASFEKMRFVRDLSEVPNAKAFVQSYHIDTLQGLKLFADSVRGIQ